MGKHKPILKSYSTTSLIWRFIYIVYFISVLDITGWLFNIPIFLSLVPAWTPMQLITALCLILTATALAIIIKYPISRSKLILPKIFCIVNFAIGLTTTLIYYHAFKTGVESPVFNLPFLNLFFSPETRMALLTGILFMFTGIIIYLLATGKPKAESIAHSLTLIVAAICYLIPVSYLLGVTSISRFLNMAVALNTGIAFCFICIIIFLARPNTWLMKLYTSTGDGSMMARRLSPGLFFIPIAIAYLRLEGERHGLFDSEAGVVFVAISYTFCLLLLVWHYARSLNKTDEIRKMAEDALRQSEENFQTILDATQESIFLFDHQGRIIITNSIGAKRLNFPLKEIKGHHFREFMKPELAVSRMEHLKRVFASGKPEHFEDTRNGMTFHNYFYPCFKEGQVHYVASYSHDITEIRKKEQELIRLNRVLMALGKSSHAMVKARDEESYLKEVCKIVVEDCQLAMVWIGYARNDEAKTVEPVAYSGFEKGYLETLNVTWADNERGRGPTGTAIRIGKPAMCKNMLTDPAFSPWRNEAIKRGYASSLVLPLLDNDVAYGAISIYSTEPDPFGDVEVNFLSELASDLNYGILMMRAKRIQTIADEQLKNYASHLKEVNATKDKLFSVIAHDLRTPFTSLLGFSDLLIDNIKSYDIEMIEKMIIRINSAAKSAFVLLENLLIWARSQNGQLLFKAQNINFTLKVQDVLDSIMSLASIKNISVKYVGAEQVMGYADENMFKAIVRNLISNAIKFSHPGGIIEIGAVSKEKHVEIVVSDNGVGMNDETKNKLFKINGVSLAGTAHEIGTGLGLLICSEFIEKHGGKIWVESKLKQGSKFIFTLPHAVR